MMFKQWVNCRSLKYLRLLFTILIFTGLICILAKQQNQQNKSVCVIAQKPTKSPSDVDLIKEKSCKPHKHIFFLKTHKTASSTIMNILFRFGESNNLTFALPSYNATQFFYPLYFNAAFVAQYFSQVIRKFDIMCHHMRFHLGQVEKVMPKDTFYFTILRNPVSLMESSFTYYKTMDIFINARSLEEFMMNPYKFYNKSSKFSNYGRNLMTFDLGFDPNGPESPKYFQLAQKTVEIMFDLVLITEYFDESLVLLKDALCWTYDDVLSFPLNSRSNYARKVQPVKVQEKIKIWNQLDWQLYVYFNNTFWKKVDEFGRERMQKEVEELRRRRALQSEICLQGHVDPNYIKDESLQPYQAGIARIMGYNLKQGLEGAERSLCTRLITPELQYSNLLLKKQQNTGKTKKLVLPKDNCEL
ncbi:galactose-3-O-sulfotransferase 2-like [Pyxicephalus adspersus]|uniref:galactose-3-O-sulfotransferase 2-like n=1 Tax=Pyxicephalus adspersus TaxID=30357 RepID=UPI003B5BE44B